MKQNIVLIGLPGSGKSTVGALLAQRLGWPLLDTDEMIVQREGRSGHCHSAWTVRGGGLGTLYESAL